MAIDTVNKRRSVVSYALVFATLLPVADGTINAQDRRQAGGEYPFSDAGVTGSGGATTGGVAGAGSATESIIGTGGASVGGVASGGSGAVDAVGTGGATVGGVASAGSGDEVIAGTGAVTTGGIASTGSGIQGTNITGDGGAAVGGVAGAGTGFTDVTGSGTAEVGGVAGAGVGVYGNTVTGTGGATTGGIASVGTASHAEIHGSGGASAGGVAGTGTGVEAVVGSGGATTKVNSAGTGQPSVVGTGGAVAGGVAAGGAESTVSGSGGAVIGGVSGVGSGCVPETIGPLYACADGAVDPVDTSVEGEATVYACDVIVQEAEIEFCRYEDGGIAREQDVISGSGGATIGAPGTVGVSEWVGLLHEPSAINNVGYNTDFSASGWDRAGNTVTPGQTLGQSTLGVLVDGNGVMTHERTSLVLGFAINVLSIYWKAGTATGGRFSLRNITSGAAEVVLTWDNVGGVPANLVLTGASAGNGSGFYPVPYAPGWYRLYFWLDNFGLTSHTRRFSVANTGSGNGYWALMQFEPGRSTTSPVQTTGVTNATRAGDDVDIIGLSNVLGPQWSWGWTARSLVRHGVENTKVGMAIVRDSPLEFTRPLLFSASRWIEHYSGQSISFGNDPEQPPGALMVEYNYIVAHMLCSSTTVSSGRRDYYRSSLAGGPPPLALTINGTSFGTQLDYVGINRLSMIPTQQAEALILYSTALSVHYTTGVEVSAIGTFLPNQWPLQDVTLFADFTQQQLPPGWTHARASVALDEFFVERGVNVPRWGSKHF